MPDRPLVTFAVIAYNQERFIREAVEGAFAQTYEPLEIILSDDGSPDRTYAIMEEMAAAYTGPHKVVLNRNEPNLGLVGHVNRIFTLSSGDLICVNAGDDFSRPDRVEVLYTRWQANGHRHDIMHSSVCAIDENSSSQGYKSPPQNLKECLSITEKYAQGKQEAFGSTFAYTRRLINKFGPIPDFAEVEDRPMVFRASLAGGLLFVDEPLVYYRIGGVSSPKQEALGQLILFGGRIKTLSWRVSSAKCYLADLETLGDNNHEIDTKQLRDFIRNGEWEIRLSQKSSLERVKLFPEAIRRTFSSFSARPLRSYLKYIFWPIYFIFLKLKNNLNKCAPT